VDTWGILTIVTVVVLIVGGVLLARWVWRQ